MEFNKPLTDELAFPAKPGSPQAARAQFMVLFNELKDAINLVPPQIPGQVAYFATLIPPTGWLKADGALFNRLTYAALFAVIGTLYGAGDGSTTFQLPDLRGQFIRGFDDGAGVDPARVMGSNQVDDFASHGHPLNIYIDHTGAGTLQGILAPMDVLNVSTPYIASNNGGTETRPKNIALLACIRY